jgi:hypothetical protein
MPPGSEAPTVSAAPGSPAEPATLAADSAAAAAESPPAPPGYEILGELGRGGMGVVYKARQLEPPRLVALKVVLAGEYAGADARARFRTEADAAARLSHPNVVAIHAVGEHDGRAFMALQLVEGGTLAGKLAPGPLAFRPAVRLAQHLGRAVQFAHERGVLHRDLKPANVLLAPADDPEEIGTPKIADFGLAKPLSDDSSLAAGVRTQTGAILGTPSYMAPEQAGGKREVGTAADVWALGAILYECLTGRPPFQAATMLDTLLQVAAEEPAPPRQLRPDCPRDLETICLKCLQKDPRRRYATAGALADDLGRYLAGEPIAARPVGRLERMGKALKRRKHLLYLAGGALTVALVSLILWSSRRGVGEEPLPAPITAGPGASATLPEDLRLIPPTASFFLTIRGGDLWARKDVRNFLMRWHRLGARVLRQPEEDLEARLAAFTRMTGFGPEHIERITYTLLKGGDFGHQVFLAALSQPFDPQQLRQLSGGGTGFDLSSTQVRGKTIWFPTTALPFRIGFAAFSDRLLCMGPVESLRWLAERADQEVTPGALAPALALATKRHLLVAGISLKQGFGDMLHATRGDGGPPVPLPEGLETITAVEDLPEPRPDQHLTSLSWELIGECTDDESARQILAAVKLAMPGLAAHIEAATASTSFGRFGHLLAEPLRTPDCRQDGRRVYVTLRLNWKPEDMEDLQKTFIDRERRDQAKANLTRIGEALKAYAQQTADRLPAAAVYGKEGQLLLSWRVLILPQLGQGELFKQFHLDEPWDGPNNKKLVDNMPPVYALIPADLDSKWEVGKTVYRAVVGSGAAFEGRQGVPLKDFSDGVAQTVLAVAAGPAVPWTKPEDLPFDPSKRPPRPAGPFSDGWFALSGDGAVRFLPASLDDKGWQALITRKAGDKPPAGLVPPAAPPKTRFPQ